MEPLNLFKEIVTLEINNFLYVYERDAVNDTVLVIPSLERQNRRTVQNICEELGLIVVSVKFPQASLKGLIVGKHELLTPNFKGNIQAALATGRYPKNFRGLSSGVVRNVEQEGSRERGVRIIAYGMQGFGSWPDSPCHSKANQQKNLAGKSSSVHSSPAIDCKQAPNRQTGPVIIKGQQGPSVVSHYDPDKKTLLISFNQEKTKVEPRPINEKHPDPSGDHLLKQDSLVRIILPGIDQPACLLSVSNDQAGRSSITQERPKVNATFKRRRKRKSQHDEQAKLCGVPFIDNEEGPSGLTLHKRNSDDYSASKSSGDQPIKKKGEVIPVKEKRSKILKKKLLLTSSAQELLPMNFPPTIYLTKIHMDLLRSRPTFLNSFVMNPGSMQSANSLSHRFRTAEENTLCLLFYRLNAQEKNLVKCAAFLPDLNVLYNPTVDVLIVTHSVYSFRRIWMERCMFPEELMDSLTQYCYRVPEEWDMTSYTVPRLPDITLESCYIVPEEWDMTSYTVPESKTENAKELGEFNNSLNNHACKKLPLSEKSSEIQIQAMHAEGERDDVAEKIRELSKSLKNPTCEELRLLNEMIKNLESIRQISSDSSESKRQSTSSNSSLQVRTSSIETFNRLPNSTLSVSALEFRPRNRVIPQEYVIIVDECAAGGPGKQPDNLQAASGTNSQKSQIADAYLESSYYQSEPTLNYGPEFPLPRRMGLLRRLGPILPENSVLPGSGNATVFDNATQSGPPQQCPTPESPDGAQELSNQPPSPQRREFPESSNNKVISSGNATVELSNNSIAIRSQQQPPQQRQGQQSLLSGGQGRSGFRRFAQNSPPSEHSSSYQYMEESAVVDPFTYAKYLNSTGSLAHMHSYEMASYSMFNPYALDYSNDDISTPNFRNENIGTEEEEHRVDAAFHSSPYLSYCGVPYSSEYSNFDYRNYSEDNVPDGRNVTLQPNVSVNRIISTATDTDNDQPLRDLPHQQVILEETIAVNEKTPVVGKKEDNESIIKQNNASVLKSQKPRSELRIAENQPVTLEAHRQESSSGVRALIRMFEEKDKAEDSTDKCKPGNINKNYKQTVSDIPDQKPPLEDVTRVFEETAKAEDCKEKCKPENISKNYKETVNDIPDQRPPLKDIIRVFEEKAQAEDYKEKRKPGNISKNYKDAVNDVPDQKPPQKDVIRVLEEKDKAEDSKDKCKPGNNSKTCKETFKAIPDQQHQLKDKCNDNVQPSASNVFVFDFIHEDPNINYSEEETDAELYGEEGFGEEGTSANITAFRLPKKRSENYPYANPHNDNTHGRRENNRDRVLKFILSYDEEVAFPNTTEAERVRLYGYSLQQITLDINHFSTDWFGEFQDDNSLHPAIYRKVEKYFGDAVVTIPAAEMAPYQGRNMNDIAQTLNYVVELYNFDATMTTKDLLKIFRRFSKNAYLKWLDQTHCLLVLKSAAAANKAIHLKHSMVQARPLTQAGRRARLFLLAYFHTIYPILQ